MATTVTDRLPWEDDAPAAGGVGGDLPPMERTALEARAGLESLESLQARRRTILAALAPLAAMHGQFGHWDAHRRQLRGAIGVEIRETWTGPKAPSAEAVEDAACADERYRTALARALDDRIRFIMLQNEVTEIEEKIRARDLELQAYNAELRLTR